MRTSSVVQNVFWEADICLAGKEIPYVLRMLKMLCRVFVFSPLRRVSNQLNIVRIRSLSKISNQFC
jgi:hypothetical protein